MPCSSAFIFNFEQINVGYGCSFVAKLSRKKFFFEKIFVFFTKYALLAEKMFLYGKKVLH